jgi:hypothetical protein
MTIFLRKKWQLGENIKNNNVDFILYRIAGLQVNTKQFLKIKESTTPDNGLDKKGFYGRLQFRSFLIVSRTIRWQHGPCFGQFSSTFLPMFSKTILKLKQWRDIFVEPSKSDQLLFSGDCIKKVNAVRRQ